MNVDVTKLGGLVGRWVLLAVIVVGGFWLIESAIHPLMKAAPLAKTLSALIGYGLIVTLVCLMRWSPLQPILAPLFDEMVYFAKVARGVEPPPSKDPLAPPPSDLVRCGAMIAIAIYGGLWGLGILIGGAMLAGVSH